MIPYVRGVPVRGTLILSRRHSEVGWPVPFFAAFNFPSVATGYPIAAGWTVGEHPNYDPRVWLEPSMFCSAVKHSNNLATRPFPLVKAQHIYKEVISVRENINWFLVAATNAWITKGDN